MSRVRRSLTAIALTIFGLGIVSSGIFFVVQAQGDRARSRSKRTSEVENQRITEPWTKAAAATTGIVTPLISEVDSDTPSTDIAEFVEISAAPSASLNGYVLVFYNGLDDLSYRAIDLDNLIADGNGLVLIANPGVPGVDRTFPNGDLENGPDAVALYLGDGAGFPNGTAITTTNLVDAVVYDTADADDAGLLTLLGPGPAQVQVDENSGSAPTTNSIQRCSDAARDGRAFVVRAATANAPNTCPQEPPVDMDGDGRSDFVIIRDSANGFASESSASQLQDVAPSRRELRRRNLDRYARGKEAGFAQAAPSEETAVWWTKSSATGATNGALWGDYIEGTFVSADFDGDNVDDMIYWRPDADDSLSGFHWINSRNSTIGFDAFGTFRDDPTVVGDYDGDGIDARAVFRCPEFDQPPGPCVYFYRSSANPSPSFNYSAWGYGTEDDFFPCPGDYDGDRKIDLCVQRLDPDSSVYAQYVIKRSSDGMAEFVNWGDWDTDFIVPGDYDGDGRSDFCARRTVGGAYVHWILYRTGGIEAKSWGGTNSLAPDDISVPGDYDGDGRTDVAIWRPLESVFWILQSSGGTRAEAWGVTSDYPLANFSFR